MDRRLGSKAMSVTAVAAIGAVAVIAVYATGIPGNGAFLLIAAIAGFATAIIAPWRIGYATLLASIAVACLVMVALGSYGGLILLVIGSLWVPASVGWLLGYVADSIRTDGVRAAVDDPRAVMATLGSLLLVAFIAVMALSFASDPP
jgi:hypothetical protein